MIGCAEHVPAFTRVEPGLFRNRFRLAAAARPRQFGRPEQAGVQAPRSAPHRARRAGRRRRARPVALQLHRVPIWSEVHGLAEHVGKAPARRPPCHPPAPRATHPQLRQEHGMGQASVVPMRPIHNSTGSVPRRQLIPTGQLPRRSAATRASGRIAGAPVSARDCPSGCMNIGVHGCPTMR